MQKVNSYDPVYTKFENKNYIWTLVIWQGLKPKFGGLPHKKTVDRRYCDVRHLRCLMNQFYLFSYILLLRVLYFSIIDKYTVTARRINSGRDISLFSASSFQKSYWSWVTDTMIFLSFFNCLFLLLI